MRTLNPLTTAFGGLVLAGLATSGMAQEQPFNSSLVGSFDQAGSTYGDIWADGNFAYLARFGQNKVDVVDISNPANPVLANTITVPNPNTAASAQDVKVGDGLLFVSLESGGSSGVAIYDVADPYNPILRTLVDPEPGSFDNIHNTFYDNGWLYLANSSDNTVAIVDLRAYNPASAPANITAWDYRLTGVASTFVHDITVVSGYLFCSGWDSLYVYDVSSLGTQAPQFVESVRGINSHAVWASAGATWVVTTEEREGGAARLYEVSTAGGFSLIPRDSWTPAKSSSYSAHNVVIDGDRAYISGYQKGALVFEIEPATKSWELVASYDTSTSSPSGFSGCWGVYPYGGADQVVLSDLSNGLYVIDFSALEIDFESAPPRTYSTLGTTSIDVNFTDLGTSILDTGSPTLFTSVNGASFTGTAMVNGGGSWSADLPVANPGERVDFYVQAMDMGGNTWNDPINAPSEFHTTYAENGLTEVLSDDFSGAMGWTVSGSASSGQWVRVNPNGTGAAPEDDDPDGSDTFCYVTDNGAPGGSDSSDDVDGGPVNLTSPIMDFSAADGLVSWTRWFFNDDADLADEMLVQLSDDGGSSWVTVNTIEITAGGWIRETVRVSDHVTPTSQVVLRFVVDDNPNNSLTEGGVDSILAQSFDGGGNGGNDASVTFRNGSGVNPAVFSTVTLPITGTDWVTSVDAAGAGAAGGLTFLFSYQNQLGGIPSSFGEILVDLSSAYVDFTFSAVSGGTGTHSSPVPNDPSLIGFAFSSQAFVNQVSLVTNALDAIIGDQ
ncbi:MAG: hypothetical protein ACI8QS_002204 [Planctomycetota bacterium]|jgi:hypothetical protein